MARCGGCGGELMRDKIWGLRCPRCRVEADAPIPEPVPSPPPKRGGLRQGAGRKVGEGGMKHGVSVSLNEKTLARVDTYAKDHGLSRSGAIDALIERGLG